jgi:hypothetical protein
VTSALALDLPDDDNSPDRREGPRHISVLRVGRVEWGGADQLCVVRNISPGGLMFECLHAPAIGQPVTIELRTDKKVMGVVRWSRDGSAGVAFDDPINVERMLNEMRSALLRVRPRAPRFVRRGTVKLIGEGEPILADIVDIAMGGVSCRPNAPVKMGEPIVASIDGLCATNAELRWKKGDVVGVRFEKQLPWRAFQAWLDKAPRA